MKTRRTSNSAAERTVVHERRPLLVLAAGGDERRHHAVVHVVVEGHERAGVPARHAPRVVRRDGARRVGPVRVAARRVAGRSGREQAQVRRADHAGHAAHRADVRVSEQLQRSKIKNESSSRWNGRLSFLIRIRAGRGRASDHATAKKASTVLLFLRFLSISTSAPRAFDICCSQRSRRSVRDDDKSKRARHLIARLARDYLAGLGVQVGEGVVAPERGRRVGRVGGRRAAHLGRRVAHRRGRAHRRAVGARVLREGRRRDRRRRRAGHVWQRTID